jgi:hypothetical protein
MEKSVVIIGATRTIMRQLVVGIDNFAMDCEPFPTCTGSIYSLKTADHVRVVIFEALTCLYPSSDICMTQLRESLQGNPALTLLNELGIEIGPILIAPALLAVELYNRPTSLDEFRTYLYRQGSELAYEVGFSPMELKLLRET